MAFLLFDDGVVAVKVKHLERLPGGTFRYYRRIPGDLLQHYPGRVHRKVPLKARDERSASIEVTELAKQDDALWASLRSPEAIKHGVTSRENRDAAQAALQALGLPQGAAHQEEFADIWTDVLDDHFLPNYGAAYEEARHDEVGRGDVSSVLNARDRELVRLVMEKPGQRQVLLSDALERYLELHDNGKDERFVRDARRCIAAVRSSAGDFPLHAYTREHAHKTIQSILATGAKTTTARRRLATIKAVFSSGVVEFDLKGIGNPFERLKIRNLGKDAEKRRPFTSDELDRIAKACLAKDDDIRHAVAIQMDTGARIEEIVGLRREDVVLDHLVPHIIIRVHHKLGRGLKTSTSERTVPLIGMALWGAQRALAQPISPHSGWLFARYASDGEVKNTHASNAVNRWISKSLKIDNTSHGFRHAMRDRLTGADVEEEYKDYILGHGRNSVARGYGEGPRGYLDKVQRRMSKAIEGSQSGT